MAMTTATSYADHVSSRRHSTTEHDMAPPVSARFRDFLVFIVRQHLSQGTSDAFEIVNKNYVAPSGGWTSVIRSNDARGTFAPPILSYPSGEVALMRRFAKAEDYKAPTAHPPAQDFREALVRGLGRYRSEEAPNNEFPSIAADVGVALASVLTIARPPEVEVNDEGTCSLYWTKEDGGEASRVALSFSGSGKVVLTIVHSSGKRGEAERIAVWDQTALVRRLGQDDFQRVISP